MLVFLTGCESCSVALFNIKWWLEWEAWLVDRWIMQRVMCWYGWLSSVLRPRQHSIGYMGDGFYRSRPNQQYRSTEGRCWKNQTTQTTKHTYT